MNNQLIMEPLAGLEEPVRLVVRPDNGRIRTCLQVTAPQDQACLLTGRPMEELPRMLGLLSPAHHLVSALALDRIFMVEPPEQAKKLRQALGLAQLFGHHLRKIFFLLNNWPGGQEQGMVKIPALVDQRNFLDRIMGNLVLAREACAILGGRWDHPLTATAGGLTRPPKPDQYRRLKDIAESCLDHALTLAGVLGERLLENNGLPEWFSQKGPGPMTGLVLDPEQDQIVLTAPDGQETDRFPVEEIFRKIELRSEPYSYLPFASLRDHDWADPLESADAGCFLLTGPLARIAVSNPSGPAAREEKDRFYGSRKTIDPNSPAAAYWALVVELVDSAEQLSHMPLEPQPEDAPIRTVPVEWKDRALAAMETPAGLICHQYQVNSQGLVEAVRLLDPAAINNARRCAAVQKAVETDPKPSDRALKLRAEISLWPY